MLPREFLKQNIVIIRFWCDRFGPGINKAEPAYGTYLKWALLWGWHVNAARGIQPNLPIFDESEETWRGLEDPSTAAPEPEAAGKER